MPELLAWSKGADCNRRIRSLDARRSLALCEALTVRVIGGRCDLRPDMDPSVPSVSAPTLADVQAASDPRLPVTCRLAPFDKPSFIMSSIIRVTSSSLRSNTKCLSSFLRRPSVNEEIIPDSLSMKDLRNSVFDSMCSCNRSSVPDSVLFVGSVFCGLVPWRSWMRRSRFDSLHSAPCKRVAQSDSLNSVADSSLRCCCISVSR